MSFRLIGDCDICERACSDLDTHTGLCSTCLVDSIGARRRRAKYILITYLYRLIALGVVVAFLFYIQWLCNHYR